jgi:NADH dehydrogenase (ubiquinone) 1 alpha subcomplex subunit 5
MRSSVSKALMRVLPGVGECGWACTALAAGFSVPARGLAKTTTGIVGLPVDEEARQSLKDKLHEVLEAVKIIPADAEYRRAVEATCQSKLTLVDSIASDEQLESQFGRQLEQEIKLCREELKLIPKMVEWAPWDVPPGHTVEMIAEQDLEAKMGGGEPNTGATGQVAGSAPPPPPHAK